MRTYIAWIVAITSLVVATPLPQEQQDQASSQNNPDPSIDTNKIAAAFGQGTGSIFTGWTAGGDQTGNGDQSANGLQPDGTNQVVTENQQVTPGYTTAVLLGEQPASPNPETAALGIQQTTPVDPTTAALSGIAGPNPLLEPKKEVADAASWTPSEYIYSYDKSPNGYLNDPFYMPVFKCPTNLGFKDMCCWLGDCSAGMQIRNFLRIDSNARADSRDGAYGNDQCKTRDHWRCCRDKVATDV